MSFAPVRERVGRVGDRVRLRPPADWGWPSLATAKHAVPNTGVVFRVPLPATGETVAIAWLPVMTDLAREWRLGVVLGHHGGVMPGLLPVVQFAATPYAGEYRCVVHPLWIELVEDDPCGPVCRCDSFDLVLRGCVCGRFRREQAFRFQQNEHERGRA